MHVNVYSGHCAILSLCEWYLPPIFEIVQCPTCTNTHNGLGQIEIEAGEGFQDQYWKRLGTDIFFIPTWKSDQVTLIMQCFLVL